MVNFWEKFLFKGGVFDKNFICCSPPGGTWLRVKTKGKKKEMPKKNSPQKKSIRKTFYTPLPTNVETANPPIKKRKFSLQKN